MMVKITLSAVLLACVWGVLNPRLQTRTLGTLALSLVAILAMVGLCN